MKRSEMILNATGADWQAGELAAILEAEKNGQSEAKKRFAPRLVLAAVLAAAMIIGAAATGLYWLRPEVKPYFNETGGGQMVYVNADYTTLAPGTVSQILDNAERYDGFIKSYYRFDDPAGWQGMFGLPFVYSDTMTAIPEDDWGEVTVMIGGEDRDGEAELSFMASDFWLDVVPEPLRVQIGDRIRVHQYVYLSREAAETGNAWYTVENGTAGETENYTTPNGIPCAISRIDTDTGMTTYLLYYGFESSVYVLSAVRPADEAPAVIAALKAIADSLVIHYPAG